MLRLLPFKKNSHQSYSVSDSSFLVHVKLLDGSVVDLSLPVETTGGECLDRVAAHLNLRQTDYFGLQFQSKNGDTMRWVERDAVLKKHFMKYGRVPPLKSEADLVFGVQYFTNNIGALSDEIARLLFYLELKRNVLQGRLPCQTNMAFKLASFALQAELGDFSPERHTREFIEDIDLIPGEILQTQNIYEVVEKVKKLYQRHKGISSDGAILMYLKSAMQLPEYGHQGIEAQDGRRNRICIGTCFIGMFVKHYNARPAIYFRWPDILRMKVKDRNLGIETATEEILFKLEDKELAKYALRQMSTQHQFYSNELRKAGQRSVRSRSVEPALHRHREPVVTDRRPCETPTGSPLKKKGKFQSHKVAEPRLDVRPLTPESTNVFALESAMVPPPAPAHHSHYRTTEVEVHSHEHLPVSRRPESPKREGPIQKLVTVVRRESSKRATAHQIEDANFADVPSHDEEVPVMQDLKVSPMISKYVPRNLRESLSVNGFSEKGNNMHPSIFGLSREQWTDQKELELSSISEPAMAAVVSPSEEREEHAAEMQIDLGSTSSHSGSVSPMSVPVIVREGGAELEQALPQSEPEKLESPGFTEPGYITESSALTVDDSDEDLQQPETLPTSKYEPRNLKMVEDGNGLRPDADALGPQISVLIEENATEHAELSFNDDEGDEEGSAGEEEETSTVGEEVERDAEEDSDTDVDLQDDDDEDEDSVEEDEADADRPPPSSLSLHPDPRLSPLGQHYIIDHPNAVEEVDYAVPGNTDKLVEMLEDKLQSGSLIREYARIPKIRVDAKISSATSSRNIYRNRYRDVLPYDDSRVQLNPSNNLANVDYINASYVNFTTGSKSKQYIVCQGPLPHTCTDFWQMVWEHSIQCIVMVTNTVEAGRQKCHQYFPIEEGEQVQFEQYRITCIKTANEQVVNTKELQLRHIPSGRVLDLVHLHFTDWPDHGAPQDPSSFVELMHQMRHLQSSLPSDAMTVVHCSAGVGRSGVAVLMDLLIERFSQSLDVDIQKSLRELRKQRMHLVQTPIQYVFVHHALLEYLQTLKGGSDNETDC